MRAALREAAKGVGRTSPNPAVGAVIVVKGRIVARGYHRAAGEPHAEIEALRGLEDRRLARGGTLYVTLEPCSTRGRTPPCVEAIIGAGFGRVVVGAIDPNPAHAGRGVELLRAAGIRVETGVLGEECRALNPGFNKWIVTGVPFVIAKAGMSLDARLSRPPGEGRWITSAASRRHAHRLRASVDAILVGAGTVRADNPRLTVRGIPGARQPWRVVVTRSGDLPAESHLFTDEFKGRTLVYAGKSLREVLRELGGKGITSVLIEGGGKVLGEAFDRGLVDRVHLFMAPVFLGGPNLVIRGRGVAASIESAMIGNPCYEKVGSDLHLGEISNRKGGIDPRFSSATKFSAIEPMEPMGG